MGRSRARSLGAALPAASVNMGAAHNDGRLMLVGYPSTESKSHLLQCGDKNECGVQHQHCPRRAAASQWELRRHVTQLWSGMASIPPNTTDSVLKYAVVLERGSPFPQTRPTGSPFPSTHPTGRSTGYLLKAWVYAWRAS